MNKIIIATALGCAALAAPMTAHAFCGFYVAGGDQQMFNDATQVVLMRKGTRTVLAMQNNYKGPPEAFAMVIPVPTVLHEGDVKTLTLDVFQHVEQMGAPRLVEYWEQNPCPEPRKMMAEDKMERAMPAPSVAHAAGRGADLGVTVEAKFVVGEYQIVILSAKDSTGLDTWLHQEKYNVPAGAEPLLRPYVEGGMKFFVAKVDPQKVKWVEEAGGVKRAALSPLRFHYDTERFELPIRLGLANSNGTQDLIVNILAPNQRYEVANYPNVTIPTNLDVRDSVKDKFGAFYTALFDRTVEKHPGAVVTEYAWQATTCDPCPGPALGPNDFQTLGADVLDTAKGEPASPQMGGGRRGRMMPYGYGADFVLTRLHARYGKDIKDDLQFKAADPIVGGREHVIDPQTGKLEEGAQKDAYNNFQGRYAIRHEWAGPITCANPVRHQWGGPPGDPYGYNAPMPAMNIAFAPRGQVQLPQVIKRDLPEIDVKMDAPPEPRKRPATAAEPRGPEPTIAKPTGGCGCQSSDASGGLLFGLALLVGLRRRPSAKAST
jgi:MYXO-CTERM domain-containing protein